MNNDPWVDWWSQQSRQEQIWIFQRLRNRYIVYTMYTLIIINGSAGMTPENIAGDF